jgi:glycine betaine/proline transport system substrate-binding protein
MGAMPITYLDGMGDSGFGAATVHTNVRQGYVAECPNVGKFISNLKFDLNMEGADDGRHPEGRFGQRCRQGLAEGQSGRRDAWLNGVTTFDGGDAAAAVKAALEG